MHEHPFISVIMPVYGVEKYLKNTVKSVLSQTMPCFELILVDDCSPDGSGEICDMLEREDRRIKVVHLPKNGGVSNARNTAIPLASGEYIFFMDSDDTIAADLFETFEKALQRNKAQITVFGMREDYYDRNDQLAYSKEIKYGEELLISNLTQLRRQVICMEQKTLYGYAWNKFYEADFLLKTGARFETVTLNEDIIFNVAVFQNAQSLNILNISPYYYKKRINKSLTNKFVPDYFLLHQRRIQIIYDQYLKWELCTDEVKNILANLLVRYVFSALQRNCDKRAGMRYGDRKQFLKELYASSLFTALIQFAGASGRIMQILIRILRVKKNFLTLMVGRVIFLIKNKLPILFAKLKQKNEDLYSQTT